MSLCRLIALFVGIAWVCPFVGCSPKEQPRRYRAPKEEKPASVRSSPAMAAGAPAGTRSPRLAYDVPKGWVPGQVGGMRKAAFMVQDGQRKVEITAIDLAARAGELLPNVNRWREQIQLGATTQGELDKTAVPIQVAGVEGRYVELMGPEDEGNRQAILGVVVIQGGKAWFFKLWGDAQLALQEKERFQNFVKSVRFVAPQRTGSAPPHASSAAAGAGSPPIKYEVPEGWVPGKGGAMRKASFVVEDSERKVEITVIDLAATGVALLPNVNLWRRQIQLDETTQGELDKVSTPLQVAGVEGHYVELVGPEQADPRQAILGVVVERGGRAWFFKLFGDAELALREKDRFQEFVKSIKFGAAGGAVNGD